ncbi:hypothetical protein [Longimicrobium sp.]|uniref:hypothetical protein n=1 Tax=Longimicrobium sp. TaxID=2029185 RepID=UPI002CF4F52F|nr:hypothetical protein [Longimicrobium sp.]HSU12477.1 hypothetical protein [Longimicrobium sp.]
MNHAKTSETKVEAPAQPAPAAPQPSSLAAVPAASQQLSAPAGGAELAAMADLAGDIAGLGATTLEATGGITDDPVRAAQASVVDELAKGGPAFGAFLRSVGLAVAETQGALDKTLVETSKALSEAKVQTVAMFTQELKDDGTFDKATPVMQELPLIAFVQPTAYQFTTVHLTADMEASEFNTANGFNIKKDHSDFGADLKASYSVFGGFGGSLDASYNNTHDETQERKSSSERKAAGKLHMEATLEPRPAFALPQPFVVQKGPKLGVLVTGRKELDKDGNETTDPKLVTQRTVTAVATLLDKDGKPMATKALDVACDNANIGVVVADGGKTTTDGTLTITLKRTGLTAESSAAVSALLRVSMNLVNASVPVSV